VGTKLSSRLLPLDARSSTIKQPLSAIRQCFDWLVSGGMLEANPAASVYGPKHVVKKGKIPVLDAGQAATKYRRLISRKKK
jgi:site-specific recombinase XerC